MRFALCFKCPTKRNVSDESSMLLQKPQAHKPLHAPFCKHPKHGVQVPQSPGIITTAKHHSFTAPVLRHRGVICEWRSCRALSKSESHFPGREFVDSRRGCIKMHSHNPYQIYLWVTAADYTKYGLGFVPNWVFRTCPPMESCGYRGAGMRC